MSEYQPRHAASTPNVTRLGRLEAETDDEAESRALAEPARATSTDAERAEAVHLEANHAANQRAAELDPAFRAFLELPDADPALNPRLLHCRFESVFVGCYGSRFEAARSLTPIGQVEDAVTTCEEDGIDASCVRIDYGQLFRIMEIRWNLVGAGDQVYVFEK
ncbi:MAG: hypothetical protein LBU05_00490 [Bifidobacteriaceae bacterium]|jgi:hypothetical protein|nr:hypothetical protein [Bifidobacteriaceae bacterium]